MRTIVLTVGTPGCGKSTWIKQNNLEQYTICPDDIRLLIQSPKYDIYGKQYISQRNDKKVWKLVFELIEERMKRGEFIVVDATHSRPTLINRYKKLAEQYRYRIIAVDFRLYNLSIDEILRRNKSRPEYKHVPEDAIKNIYERLKTMKIPSGVKVIHPDEFKQLENILFDFTDKYDKVVFIGDIHGCYREYISLMNKIDKHIKENDKVMYIFLGDYFDRGKYNADTFVSLYNLMKDKTKDTLFLTGNHDNYIKFYKEYSMIKDKNNEQMLKQFIKDNRIPINTVKTFEEFYNSDMIKRKDVTDFYRRLGQLAYFKFGDRVYVATHGGIPNIPNIYQATEEFIHGIGRYSEINIVEESFMKNTPDNYYMVHGHRNIFNDPIKPCDRCFNLNGNAEIIDGELRALIVDKDGNEIEITQPTIDGYMTPVSDRKLKLDNIKFEDNSILKYMKDHDFVKVKEHTNQIFSCNFTNKAFFRREWDDITIKARGLFIGLDENNKEYILVRGYNKFFNVGEFDYLRTESLSTYFKYPVVAYRKYNGFLGLLSVDKRSKYKGNWLIHTKGSTEGEFVDMFKEILEPYLTDELNKYILENDVTLLFEVLHVDDKHIEDIEENKIVLLDIVKNDIEEQLLPYEELIKVANKFGFEYKQIYRICNNFKDVYELIEELENTEIFSPTGIEGVVLVDTENNKVKVKSRWYKFWKWVRKLRDEIKKIIDRHDLIVKKGLQMHKFEETYVFNYLIKHPELLDKHVIDIREEILKAYNSEKA